MGALRMKVYILALVFGCFSAATVGAAAYLPLEQFGRGGPALGVQPEEAVLTDNLPAEFGPALSPRAHERDFVKRL